MTVRSLATAALSGIVFLGATCIAALSATAYQTPLKPAIIPDGIPTLTVTSTTFQSGGTFPIPNVSKGCGTGPSASSANDVSPQISWTAGPPGTASYVVTMFDTDAPTSVGFWHWIVFNIPPSVTSLALDATKNMPAGAIQGYGDAGVSAYHGPCPPVGDPPHHYWITVSAMDKMFTGFGPGATGARIAFLQSKVAKILARGQLLGRYGR
jgi:Raf kinase inhibitor-like YbhB/YbcL family protein